MPESARHIHECDATPTFSAPFPRRHTIPKSRPTTRGGTMMSWSSPPPPPQLILALAALLQLALVVSPGSSSRGFVSAHDLRDEQPPRGLRQRQQGHRPNGGLHHWKDASSFADVVLNNLNVDNAARGTPKEGTSGGRSRERHLLHVADDDQHKSQHNRHLTNANSKSNSDSKDDEEDTGPNRNAWMLDMIKGGKDVTFGSENIYNAYTLDLDRSKKQKDTDTSPAITTSDGEPAGINRDGLHFMAPRSGQSFADVALPSSDIPQPMSCNPADFVLPPTVQEAATAAQFPGPVHVFATVAALQGGFASALRQYETPLVLRFTRLIDMLDWNCAASFHHSWNDALTFGEPLVRAPSQVNGQAEMAFDLHTSDARLMCMIHGWTAVVRYWIPEAVHPLLGVLQSLGLGLDSGNIDIDLNFDPDVDQCFDLDGMQTAWDDKDGGLLHSQQSVNTDCLRGVARQNCFTPKIVGKIIARQIHQYATYDGWNMSGEFDGRGQTCMANCRPYTDPTDYHPNSDKGERWHPLLEDNGRGFQAYQQHVVPHIGTAAKRALLSSEEFEGDKGRRVAPDPKYKYDEEAKKVIERLGTLDDTKKSLIEFFDDKLDVAFVVIGAVAQLGASFEQVLNYVVGLTAAEYDSLLLAWKEKVRHDLVRPTTWINKKMAKDKITTWAGPYQGVKTFEGRSFDAYVRVMPHSEYPSGSACICGALAEYTDGWLESFGQSLRFPLPQNQSSIPIHVPTILKGSLRTEPGLSPKTNITVTYANLQELATACGESRLDGGMHFERAVEASYDLCDGVGSLGAVYASHLVNDNW